MRLVIVLLVVAPALAGCDDGFALPSAPSPPLAAPLVSAPVPPAIRLAVFTDPASGFSTSDVRDVQDQLVRFNSADELIWVASDTRFPEYLVDGNSIGYHHSNDTFFQVRFGSTGGERRAYLTRPDSYLRGAAATILDLSVDARGDLIVADTNVPIPGT